MPRLFPISLKRFNKSGDFTGERPACKILITNVYSWKNKGDAAIVFSLLDDVRRQFPDCHLAISSTDGDSLDQYGIKEHYQSVLKIFKKRFPIKYPNLLGRLLYAFHHVLFRFRLQVFSALSKIRIYPYFLFSDEMSSKIRSYAKFDLVIACGGGYLLQPRRLPKLDRWFRVHDAILFAYDFYLANIFNKPYILYNQSIGPFYRQSDFLAYVNFLKDARIVLCRESLTFDRLADIGLKNIRQVADIAFHLAVKPSNILSRYTNNKNGIKIGLTVRNWLDNTGQNLYENALREFIRNVLSLRDDAQFFFMPQVHYSAAGDDDSIVSQRIYNNLPDNLLQSVYLISEDLHPSELKYAIGQMDYFIGTRMHSNIFALSMGVKTIAIAYEPKTTGIMKGLELTQYVIPMEEVTADSIFSLFNKATIDNNYLPMLKIGVENMRQLAICDLHSFLT
ncbi:MAG: polysaccharide pyruvyl transferase family protein [Desulfobacteraceae bacterium]|nr:polysaccharide pyruvyl transferase family protein [Desulfobacteraceae bacterium]